MSATSVGVAPSGECLRGEGLVAGWGSGVFASCLVRCTAPPPLDFTDQLPLPRLYSAPGFLMEVVL